MSVLQPSPDVCGQNRIDDTAQEAARMQKREPVTRPRPNLSGLAAIFPRMIFPKCSHTGPLFGSYHFLRRILTENMENCTHAFLLAYHVAGKAQKLSARLQPASSALFACSSLLAHCVPVASTNMHESILLFM